MCWGFHLLNLDLLQFSPLVVSFVFLLKTEFVEQSVYMLTSTVSPCFAGSGDRKWKSVVNLMEGLREGITYGTRKKPKHLSGGLLMCKRKVLTSLY